MNSHQVGVERVELSRRTYKIRRLTVTSHSHTGVCFIVVTSPNPLFPWLFIRDFVCLTLPLLYVFLAACQALFLEFLQSKFHLELQPRYAPRHNDLRQP